MAKRTKNLDQIAKNKEEELKKEQKKEPERTPPVVKTEHKKINIINKETVVVEKVLSKKEKTKESDLTRREETVKQIKFSAQNIPVFNDRVLGVKTTADNQFNKHLFSSPPQIVKSSMKTSLSDAEDMLWNK